MKVVVGKEVFGVDIYDSELNITEHYFSEVDIFTGDVITSVIVLKELEEMKQEI